MGNARAVAADRPIGRVGAPVARLRTAAVGAPTCTRTPLCFGGTCASSVAADAATALVVLASAATVALAVCRWPRCHEIVLLIPSVPRGVEAAAASVEALSLRTSAAAAEGAPDEGDWFGAFMPRLTRPKEKVRRWPVSLDFEASRSGASAAAGGLATLVGGGTASVDARSLGGGSWAGAGAFGFDLFRPKDRTRLTVELMRRCRAVGPSGRALTFWVRMHPKR